MLVTNFNFKQGGLQIIRIGMQKLILSDDAIERVRNQRQVTHTVAHLAPEPTGVIRGRRNYKLIEELARIIHYQLNWRPVVTDVYFWQERQPTTVSEVPNQRWFVD